MTSDIYLRRAWEILIKEGIEQINMDLLAEKIGTTKRTIYNHFESREDFFQCLIDYQIDALKDSTLPLFSISDINSKDILKQWLVYNIDFNKILKSKLLSSLHQYDILTYNYFTASLRQYYTEFLALLIPRGRRENLFIDGFNTDSFANFVFSIIIHNPIDDYIPFIVRSISKEEKV